MTEAVPSERDRVEALRVLGLPRGARQPEIRTAYIALARELHPDLHPDDAAREERFQRVAAAYELLRRYYRHLAPGSSHPTQGDERFDPQWWAAFGEKV